ncbi:Glyoxalase/Bleomycin resistance protein/dioxygenase domain [Candidatus Burkholderia verschuerenii]|uniref:Glyoxalase/Bleomycin resistance protein/dioxygenase domain n=1 Tax=Candidatus Burkholderia verschuerenii TaxID=242163 RepID=A0A0L0MEY3_9BURK|nr:VOC family protein [Candidatus Burkholderia verschuerenii]KND60835.1 Glyoxalase/Bleomycin resistance protein/dioxygenase domain [Candidatus Burkholderia verschuerenii]
MPAKLNHTIVWSSDPAASARFLAALLALPAPVRFGPFHVVELDNGVSLDFARSDETIQSQHYAFLIEETDFDDVLARIRAQALEYWADPAQRRPGEINHNDGGRGVYFLGPDGHFLEVITRPYGSGAT